MKTYYEIVLWCGSSCPNIDVRHFEIDEAEEALQCFKEHVALARAYHITNPKDDGLPYLSIKKYRNYDFVEYGNTNIWFDFAFTDLPKYVQRKCATVIAYDLSLKD